MNHLKWLFHPILVFVFSVSALVASLFLYIYWYIGVSTGLRSAMERFKLEQDQVFAADTWVVILVLSILIGTILLGIFIIFVFSQKTMQLYRMQNNFINNFTHELKTPVTSLQLYLQTFSKHKLKRNDQLKYIQYMLTDVNRFAQCGEEGVLALLSDSTNVEKDGHTISAQEIGSELSKITDAANGRIIVALFASNIARIQQIVNIAKTRSRKIIFNGRSIEVSVACLLYTSDAADERVRV